MAERITRINDTKIELGRCSEEELYSMAEYIQTRIAQAERELEAVGEEIRSRLVSFDEPLSMVAD